MVQMVRERVPLGEIQAARALGGGGLGERRGRCRGPKRST